MVLYVNCADTENLGRDVRTIGIGFSVGSRSIGKNLFAGMFIS